MELEESKEETLVGEIKNKLLIPGDPQAPSGGLANSGAHNSGVTRKQSNWDSQQSVSLHLECIQ